MPVDTAFYQRRFGRAVVLFVTLGCPLVCAHCSSASGPGRTEQFPLDELERVVSEIARHGETELLVLTGGEPFLDFKRLRRIIEAAKQCGLAVEIVTSGYWARDGSRAEQVLESLPWFDRLSLSADRYHLPFVSLDQLRAAATAALARGIALRAFVTLENSDDDFLVRLRGALGQELVARIEFRVVQLHLVGRAASDVELEQSAVRVDFDRLPSEACLGPASPALREDGRVMACCGDCMSDPANWPALTLGNWREENLASILQRAERDPLIQALRLLGPVELGRRACERAGTALFQRTFELGNVCDACRAVTGDAKVLEHVQAWLADPEVRTALALERALQFAEPARVGDKDLGHDTPRLS